MKKRVFITGILSFLFILLFSSLSIANETSVKLVAPEKAKKGSEVTVKIEVSHSGNNFLHYSNWVLVKVNGKEYKKWEYGGFDKPEDNNFTLEITLKIDEDTTIEAEGNCNLHGSAGPKSIKITTE
jgi:desulfoferrodoxin (superoxide reductase-like protein)